MSRLVSLFVLLKETYPKKSEAGECTVQRLWTLIHNENIGRLRENQNCDQIGYTYGFHTHILSPPFFIPHDPSLTHILFHSQSREKLGASKFLIVDKEQEADRAKLSDKLTQMLLQRLQWVFPFSFYLFKKKYSFVSYFRVGHLSSNLFSSYIYHLSFFLSLLIFTRHSFFHHSLS